MTLEQYRAKKIEEFDKHRFDFVGDISFLKVKKLLSQTIDELYAELQPKDVTALYAGLRVLESDYLPKDVCMIGTGKKCGSAAFSQKVEVKAEAERMRDLNINKVEGWERSYGQEDLDIPCCEE